MKEPQYYLDTDNVTSVKVGRVKDRMFVTWYDRDNYYHEIEFFPSVDSDEEKTRDERKLDAEWALAHLD